VLKVQHKPIKRSKLGFKRKEQKKPKRTLVGAPDCPVCHRTVSVAPPDSVRCPVPYNFKPATFGFLESRSAIIHRTVRSVDSNGHLQKRYSARTVRVESEQPPEGSPDSEQCLSGAAPDCPVLQDVRAPMVEIVRTLTVG
jgi:hypothetical protein